MADELPGYEDIKPFDEALAELEKLKYRLSGFNEVINVVKLLDERIRNLEFFRDHRFGLAEELRTPRIKKRYGLK